MEQNMKTEIENKTIREQEQLIIELFLGQFCLALFCDALITQQRNNEQYEKMQAIRNKWKRKRWKQERELMTNNSEGITKENIFDDKPLTYLQG
jgi:hypothetical protein